MDTRNILHKLVKLSSTIYSSVVKPSNIISFFSYPAYYGNAKSVYQYIIENKIEKRYNVKLLWLVNNRIEEKILKNIGINVCYIKEVSCLKKYLESMIHVSDSFFIRSKNLFKGKHTHYVFTWHGIPFKMSLRKCWPNTLSGIIDKAIATSTYTIPLLSSFLGICPQKFVVTGYPRNDMLFLTQKSLATDKLSKILGIDLRNYDFLILYSPTFRYAYRVTGNINEIEGIPISIIGNMNTDDLFKLNHTLQKHNTLLIIKYHHHDEYYIKNVNKSFSKINKFIQKKLSNIQLLMSEDILSYGSDIYDILPAFDILITDYSSIFYDFLLLNRPIIFYMYDLEKYYTDRGLIVQPKSIHRYTPGPVIKNSNLLIKTIEDTLQGLDSHLEKRLEMIDLIYEFKDSKASYRVWNNIIRPIFESNLS